MTPSNKPEGLSPENASLLAAEQFGIVPGDGSGWWRIHADTLNRLLDAARSESRPPADVGLVEAAQLTLDEATEYGYGTADVHLVLHHDAYHALERALAPFTTKETDHG